MLGKFQEGWCPTIYKINVFTKVKFKHGNLGTL